MKLKDACAIFEIEKLDLISSSKLHQLIFGKFVHKFEAEMGKLRLIALQKNNLESFAFSIDAPELVDSRIGLSLRPHPNYALTGIQ